MVRSLEALQGKAYMRVFVPCRYNPLNSELNPICHLLALLGSHYILHVSRIRVKDSREIKSVI